MYKFRTELRYLWRYACAGGLNTVVGLSAIFLFMEFGFSPVLANVFGYMIGLTLGFFTARLFVFESSGKLSHETFRYLISFSISFACNLGALILAIDIFNVTRHIAQLCAILVYVAIMYVLSRYFVFSMKRT